MAGFTRTPQDYDQDYQKQQARYQEQLDQENQTAKDPMSAPGVHQGIIAAGQQAARATQAATGQALSRAATSGQATIPGVMSDVGRDIEARSAESLQKISADTIRDAYKEARDRGLSISEAMSTAQNQAEQIRQQQRGVEEQERVSQAQLAQQESQYGRTLEEQKSEFGQELGFKGRQLEEQRSQFGQTLALNRSQFGSELAFRKAQLEQQGSQFGQELGFKREQLRQQANESDRDFQLRMETLTNQQRQFSLTLQQQTDQFNRNFGLQEKQLGMQQEQFAKEYNLKSMQMQQQGKSQEIINMNNQISAITASLTAGAITKYEAGLRIKALLG